MDAASDAIEWALTNNDRLPEIDNLGGYLYRVGQTKARALLRPQPVPEAPMPPTIPMVEPQLPGALNALSETQRVCVVMVHALGYPQVEVAGMLGVSESTVRTHLRRALSTLRKELNVE